MAENDLDCDFFETSQGEKHFSLEYFQNANRKFCFKTQVNLKMFSESHFFCIKRLFCEAFQENIY